MAEAAITAEAPAKLGRLRGRNRPGCLGKLSQEQAQPRAKLIRVWYAVLPRPGNPSMPKKRAAVVGQVLLCAAVGVLGIAVLFFPSSRAYAAAMHGHLLVAFGFVEHDSPWSTIAALFGAGVLVGIIWPNQWGMLRGACLVLFWPVLSFADMAGAEHNLIVVELALDALAAIVAVCGVIGGIFLRRGRKW